MCCEVDLLLLLQDVPPFSDEVLLFVLLYRSGAHEMDVGEKASVFLMNSRHIFAIIADAKVVELEDVVAVHEFL